MDNIQDNTVHLSCLSTGQFRNAPGPDGVFRGWDPVPRNRIALLKLCNGFPEPWKSGTMPKDGQERVIGPWDLLTDENHLYIGGKFFKVAGLDITHLTRFTFS